MKRSSPNRVVGASLFGKLPLALDFVRVHHDYAESILLDRWLQTGLQRLAARGHSWPEGAQRFLMCAPGAEYLLVGAVVASRDRAGRRFPLAVYACVPGEWSRGFAAALLLAAEPFLAEAEGLLARSARLPIETLQRELGQLSVVRQAQLLEARHELDAQLSSRSLASFVQSVFDDVPLAMALEAFRRLLGRRAPEGSVVDCYDCPVRSTLDAACWLELLELSRPAACSALWQCDGEAPRMLLSYGSLPERAGLFWATPSVKHPQVSRLGCGAVNVGGGLPDAAEGGQEALAHVFARLVRDRL